MLPRFLLDCDPGIDDAFAILCALKFGRVDLITTVSGNVPINKTTRNALHILELAGANVPVHRGADRPLRVAPSFADDIHGESGLGNYYVPEPQHCEHDVDATHAIIEYCERGDAVIVATGPLTNIALALRADPTLAARIRHLHWMGGATTHGNTTEFAEFNAWCDPDAAAETMQSGVAMTMYDLDLTTQVRMGPPEIDRLRTANTQLATFFADALAFYSLNLPPGVLGKPMHDPCAVLGFLQPAHFTTRASNIVCAAAEDEQRGRTIVNFTEDHLPHAVAIAADSKVVVERILMAILEPEKNQ